MCNIYGIWKMRLFYTKMIFVPRVMKGKYLRLFPLTSLSKFPKHYLQIISKKRVCKNKVRALALGSAKKNWVTGWIIIDKYFRG